MPMTLFCVLGRSMVVRERAVHFIPDDPVALAFQWWTVQSFSALAFVKRCVVNNTWLTFIILDRHRVKLFIAQKSHCHDFHSPRGARGPERLRRVGVGGVLRQVRGRRGKRLRDQPVRYDPLVRSEDLRTDLKTTTDQRINGGQHRRTSVIVYCARIVRRAAVGRKERKSEAKQLPNSLAPLNKPFTEAFNVKFPLI